MDVKEWILQPESEYRFELDAGTSLAITVVRGTAEVFGAELASRRAYIFGHECKAAVFTWEGCTLEVRGRPSTEYVSDETNMWTAANLHVLFEKMRIRARRAQRGSPTPHELSDGPAHPPRVLMLGQENSGKTSMCKILTNYAVRTGVSRSPIVVNLDPGEGGWTIPGTLSACPISDPVLTSTPASPFGTAATSAPTATSSSALVPLAFWFGHLETRRNVKLLERLIRCLAAGVDSRIEHDPIAKISGTIIDTPASFALAVSTTGPKDVKHPLVKACVEAFHVNYILVTGNEKLYVEMQRMFDQRSGVSVIKIPKSGGVVELDFAYRDRVHNHQLRAYMYGTTIDLPPGVSESSLGGEASHDLTLSPHSSTISFDDLKIYRVGGSDSMAPSSALPIGAGRMVSEVQPIAVDPSTSGSGLLNAVLALLAPTLNKSADENLADRNIAGFLVITAIDIPARKMTILSPVTGSLTGRIALVGSLEWQDT